MISFITGGSDDGAGCAVMLETLRVIAHSSKLLKHNIIFLFNGAEENLLQVYQRSTNLNLFYFSKHLNYVNYAGFSWLYNTTSLG